MRKRNLLNISLTPEMKISHKKIFERDNNMENKKKDNFRLSSCLCLIQIQFAKGNDKKQFSIFSRFFIRLSSFCEWLANCCSFLNSNLCLFPSLLFHIYIYVVIVVVNAVIFGLRKLFSSVPSKLLTVTVFISYKNTQIK
jgi:hypothetical protein